MQPKRRAGLLLASVLALPLLAADAPVPLSPDPATPDAKAPAVPALPVPAATPSGPAAPATIAPAGDAPPPLPPGKGYTDVVKRSPFPGGGDPAGYFEQMKKELQNDDERRRAFAARQMQYFGDQKAIPSLILALEDRTESVRRNAGLSICELAGKDELACLIELLFHDSQDVRNRAQERMTDLIYTYLGPQDLPSQRDYMSAPDEQVGLRERWHEWWMQNRNTIELKNPPPARPPGEASPEAFGKTLFTPNEIIREAKAGQPDGPEIDYLKACSLEIEEIHGKLGSGTANEKIAVLRHVAKIFEREKVSFERLYEVWEPLDWGQRKKMEPRWQLWKDTSREEDPASLRWNAYERVRGQLWGLGDAFLSTLDGEEEVKIWAMRVCHRIPWEPLPRRRIRGSAPHTDTVKTLESSVLPKLTAYFEGGESARVRGYAAWCLGRSHSLKAVGTLIRALTDDNTFVRHEAFRGLKEICRGVLGFHETFGYKWYDHPAQRDASVEKWEAWWREYQAVETRIGELVERLGAKEWAEADRAQAELQKIGARSLPALKQAFRSENRGASLRAGRAIEQIEKSLARPLEAPPYRTDPDPTAATKPGPREPGERRPEP